MSIRSMEILWKDYGNGYIYPQKVHWERKSVTSKERLETLPKERRIKEQETQASIVVKSFNHNVNISDDVFTLHGMGIEAGTKVNDSIKGILYNYGAAEVDEKILQELIDQKDVVSEIISREDKLPDNIYDKTVKNTSEKGASNSITSYLVFFLCIIIILVLVFKYFVSLRNK